MRWRIGMFVLLIAMGVVGCTSLGEQMDLLDEPLREVKVSYFENYGGMNEETFLSFDSAEDLELFREAITTAVQSSAEISSDPDYDLQVTYNSNDGELPTHGIHMWAGEAVTFLYIADEDVYAATPQMSKKLNDLLKKAPNS
ncbi:hypothetical protein [Sporosarcina sp.]|uniref:hypothetical protein n=1 Tax=Sporosarcina sp. TaxID=49982 RepID=UPI002603179C|nr:hypothetical protein [Sporosarcina sp.]